MKDGVKYRRFLVIDILQLILVEPDQKKLGWGVAKLVGFLQDVEVVGDKDDSRCLHLTINRSGGTHSNNRTPILSAKFIFDDHIRCMAAKQRLTKGRTKARQKKMYQIAVLLEVPGQLNDSAYLYSSSSASSVLRTPHGSSRLPREHRPLFSTANRVPGVAAALRRESMPSGSVSRSQMSGSTNRPGENELSNRKRNVHSANSRRESSPISTPVAKSRESSRNRSGTPRSRESSPRTPRPRSEEIPLEDFRRSQNSSPVSRNSSNVPSRSHTPSRLAMDGTPNSSKDNSMLIGGNTSSLSIPRENSEETSFIASEDKLKKKGEIETV